MRFKRNEAFRYEFETPIPAFFTIVELNGNQIESSKGEANIIDLSLNGMKMSTSLDIHFSKQTSVKVSVRFGLNGHNYIVQGDIVWSDANFDGYYYGINLTLDDNIQEEIVEDLKYLGKSNSDKGTSE